MAKAIGQITIRDENDISVGTTAPKNPVVDQMWLDTSVKPSVLKRYNGIDWDVVNETEIGVRNLAKYSRNFGAMNLGNWLIVSDEDNFKAITITTTATEWRECQMAVYPQYNSLTTDLVISFEYQSSTTDLLVFNFGTYINSTNLRQNEIINWGVDTNFVTENISNNWKRAYLVFNPTSLNGKSGDCYRIQFKKNTGKTGTIKIRKVKLEKGNKPTDWTPAPEDVDERIESNTTAINIAQGHIDALISENTIINGDVSVLKSDYASISAKVDGISTTVASQTTTIADIKTTSDSKAKVFTTTPTVPYKIGDLWVQGMTGDVLKSKVNRLTGSYVSTDWEKASKYTDDTKANAVEGSLNTLSGKVTTVENNYTSLEQNLEGFKTTVSNTYSTKTEFSTMEGKVESITSKVSAAESSIDQLVDSVALKVEATYVDEIVEYLNAERNNLWRKTKEFNSTENAGIWISNFSTSSPVVVIPYMKENGFNVIRHKGANIDVSQFVAIERDQVYTLSGWFASGDKTSLATICFEVLGGSIKKRNFNDYDTMPFGSFKRFYVTFYNSHAGFSYCRFFAGNDSWHYIYGLKLEKGNTMSDWTPSNDDIESSISTVNSSLSELKIETASITSRVGSSETNIKNIDGSITSLQTRMNTAEQKITDSSIISTVQSTINQAKTDAISSANLNTANLLTNYYTTSQAQSDIEQTSNSILSKVSTASKLLTKNAILTGDFSSTSGSATITNWTKNTISGSAGTYSTDGSTWCNFYTSTLAGELFAYQEITVDIGKPYEFSCKVAKYGSTNQYYCIRIQEYVSGAWVTKKEFTGIVTSDRSSPIVLYTKYKPTVSQARIWIGKVDGQKFDIYVTDFQMFYTTDVVKSAEFQILDDKVSTKVSSSDFSTTLEQNSYSVRIAWNKISNYVQFENGGISIYNGSVATSQKRAVFDENGNHYWRDGYYLGKTGTNQYDGNSAIKGIVFDLEAAGGYLTWASKKYSSDTSYLMMWSYTNKSFGDFTSGRLHAGCDIDMHNYYLRNVAFEGGGITGTMYFTQITSMTSSGTAASWYNNSRLQFQNGILIGASWGS